MKTSTITHYLERMVALDASDLHLKAGNRPGFRIDGQILCPEENPILDPEAVLACARSLMTKEQAERYEAEFDLDFSYAVKDLARFRVNVLTQRGACGLVIRKIPSTIPSLEDLGLPEICRELAAKPRGLVLVTGPTGSGKSTTLAAIIDWINRERGGHILTMEDPVEFVHEDKASFVTQRQIGQDCKSFSEALRRALRQDPDVILIGEMRDLETIGMAISAAETGHLVFGTLHTTGAISTVDRILDVFPPDQQQQVRVQLSSSLQGVVSQCLLPRIGGGRVAAHEILIATNAVRSLIREGKTPQLLNVLQTGAKNGMASLENVLARYVQEGIVSLDDAIAKANRPEEMAKIAGSSGQTRSAPARTDPVYGGSAQMEPSGVKARAATPAQAGRDKSGLRPSGRAFRPKRA